jgi:hypothetical protein
MINDVEHDDDSEMYLAIKSVDEDPRAWEGTVIIIHTSMIISFISIIFALTATQFLEKMIGGILFAFGLSGWLVGTYYFINHEDPSSKHDTLTKEYIKVLKHHFIFCKDLDGLPAPRLPKTD